MGIRTCTLKNLTPLLSSPHKGGNISTHILLGLSTIVRHEHVLRSGDKQEVKLRPTKHRNVKDLGTSSASGAHPSKPFPLNSVSIWFGFPTHCFVKDLIQYTKMHSRISRTDSFGEPLKTPFTAQPKRPCAPADPHLQKHSRSCCFEFQSRRDVRNKHVSKSPDWRNSILRRSKPGGRGTSPKTH